MPVVDPRVPGVARPANRVCIVMSGWGCVWGFHPTDAVGVVDPRRFRDFGESVFSAFRLVWLIPVHSGLGRGLLTVRARSGGWTPACAGLFTVAGAVR